MLGKSRGCECPFCTLGLNERLCSWGSECRLCPRGGGGWSRKKVGSILGKRHLLVLQLGGSLLSRAPVCGCCDRRWDCRRGSCQKRRGVIMFTFGFSLMRTRGSFSMCFARELLETIQSWELIEDLKSVFWKARYLPLVFQESQR